MMCSGPFRGSTGTQQLARLHRKGPHRLEAWRSGSMGLWCSGGCQRRAGGWGWVLLGPSWDWVLLKVAHLGLGLGAPGPHGPVLKVTHTRWPAATAADPEKNNLGVQLCSIRGCRALPGTEGHRKWCFEDRKLALQALWRTQNGTQNRLRRAHGGSSDTHGAPCARSGTPSPLGKRWRACGLQRIKHPPGERGGGPGDVTHSFSAPAPFPLKLLKVALVHYSSY